MAKRFTSTDTAFGENGARSYRIEVDISEPHRPLQRHIWTLDDGSQEITDWIPAYTTDQRRLLRGFEPITRAGA